MLTDSQARELYKILLEQSTANSEARRATNQYFMTLHATAFAALGYASQAPLSPRLAIVTTALSVMMIVFSGLWIVALNYYRRLAAAKFAVIYKVEETLPVQPMKLEWDVVAKRGLTISQLELFVPFIFGLGFALVAGEPWLAWIEAAVDSVLSSSLLSTISNQ